MGGAAKRLKKAVSGRRSFTLEADDAPTLTGEIRPVEISDMFTTVGLAESPYAHLYDGSQQSGAEVAAKMPGYGVDPEGYKQAIELGKKMGEAWLVMGIKNLTDDEGDTLTMGFSVDEDDDLVSPVNLRELYGDDQIDDLLKRITRLSNGRPLPKTSREVDPKRFPESDGPAAPSGEDVRN